MQNSDFVPSEQYIKLPISRIFVFLIRSPQQEQEQEEEQQQQDK